MSIGVRSGDHVACPRYYRHDLQGGGRLEFVKRPSAGAVQETCTAQASDNKNGADGDGVFGRDAELGDETVGY